MGIQDRLTMASLRAQYPVELQDDANVTAAASVEQLYTHKPGGDKRDTGRKLSYFFEKLTREPHVLTDSRTRTYAVLAHDFLSAKEKEGALHESVASEFSKAALAFQTMLKNEQETAAQATAHAEETLEKVLQSVAAQVFSPGINGLTIEYATLTPKLHQEIQEQIRAGKGTFRQCPRLQNQTERWSGFLHTLDLQGVDLRESTMNTSHGTCSVASTQTLIQDLPHLRRLNCSNCHLSGYDFIGLPRHLYRLQELRVNDNDLGAFLFHMPLRSRTLEARSFECLELLHVDNTRLDLYALAASAVYPELRHLSCRGLTPSSDKNRTLPPETVAERFPKLETLEISYNSEHLQQFLTALPDLKTIKIFGMKQDDAAEQAQLLKLQQQFPKVTIVVEP